MVDIPKILCDIDYSLAPNELISSSVVLGEVTNTASIRLFDLSTSNLTGPNPTKLFLVFHPFKKWGVVTNKVPWVPYLAVTFPYVDASFTHAVSEMAIDGSILCINVKNVGGWQHEDTIRFIHHLNEWTLDHSFNIVDGKPILFKGPTGKIRIGLFGNINEEYSESNNVASAFVARLKNRILSEDPTVTNFLRPHLVRFALASERGAIEQIGLLNRINPTNSQINETLEINEERDMGETMGGSPIEDIGKKVQQAKEVQFLVTVEIPLGMAESSAEVSFQEQMKTKRFDSIKYISSESY